MELSYPCGDPPPAGCTRELLPGLHWLRMPLPLKLDHVNLWLLEDGDALTVVDAGLDDDITRALWLSGLATLAARMTPKRLIVTHHHPDHCGLTEWLTARFDARLLITAREYRAALGLRQHGSSTGVRSWADELTRHGLPAGAREAMLREVELFGSLRPTVAPEFHPLADGDELDIGGRRWRVLVGGGHSPAHVSLYCREGGVLMSGDMLLPDISPNIGSPPPWDDGNPVALFLEAIARMAELPEDTLVLPSHRRPFRGLRTRVAELQQHHEDRCRALSGRLASPRSAGELMGILFPGGLDALQTGLAMQEITAHLDYLERRGEVQRVESNDGTVRFVGL